MGDRRLISDTLRRFVEENRWGMFSEAVVLWHLWNDFLLRRKDAGMTITKEKYENLLITFASHKHKEKENLKSLYKF